MEIMTNLEGNEKESLWKFFEKIKIYSVQSKENLVQCWIKIYAFLEMKSRKMKYFHAENAVNNAFACDALVKQKLVV